MCPLSALIRIQHAVLALNRATQATPLTGPGWNLFTLHSLAEGTRYYRDNDTYDAQLRYKLNRHWSFTVQAKNFTGERPARMIGLHQELLREELNNGRSWFGGVTYLFK